MDRICKIALTAGAVLYISIGLYHIFLPYIWNWQEFSKLMPDMIEWALYATNFFMSFLMVLLGVFTITIVIKNTLQNNIYIIYICALFWIANIVYQIILPTPIPVELRALKIGFFIPPILGLCIYSFCIIKLRQLKKS